jgi:hypothetical protein
MLRYKYKLSVENRMHRRLAGPKKDQEMGGWRKQHTEQIHSFYSSLMWSNQRGWDGWGMQHTGGKW